MTASRRDSSVRRAALVFLALAACRAGLPPEPPGEDPADPRAAVPAYHPPANPYAASAFSGEPAATTGGHAGHEHMNHGPAPMDHSAHTKPGSPR